MASNEEPSEKRAGDQGNRRKKVLTVYATLVILLIAGLYFYLSTDKQDQVKTKKAADNAKTTQPATSIIALTAKKEDFDIYQTGLGNVTPLNTVTVKSRVDGQLMEIRYQEGQEVAKGSLLAIIDPRPFQVLLTQAEGQMARDRAQLNNARLDLQRYQLLWQQDSIPKQQYDTQAAVVRQLEAVLKSDQGQIDNAKLQLTYSRVTAPVSGRTGLRMVDTGNIVHASDPNGLLVITTVKPIAAIFPIPEESLQKILSKLKKGEKLKVEALDRGQKQKLASGTLLTIDNQIDPGTGTVKCKALFQNNNNELFPNQFVNIRLLVDTLHDVIVIPAAALQRGPQGSYVYVVKQGKSVAFRLVTTGQQQDGKIVVLSGLEDGELVVVDGGERLRDGAKVEIKAPAGNSDNNKQIEQKTPDKETGKRQLKPKENRK